MPIPPPRWSAPCLALAAGAVALLLACSAPQGVPIEGRVLTVACAHCVFHMPDVENCPWAAELDGHYYLLTGKLPLDHNSHAPGGICTMRRQARIDGELVNDVIRVTKLELLPLGPDAAPASRQVSRNDVR